MLTKADTAHGKKWECWTTVLTAVKSTGSEPVDTKTTQAVPISFPKQGQHKEILFGGIF